MSAARDDLNLVVTRVFDAPVALVWETFTRPEHVVHWWMPKGFATPLMQAMDVRPGGTWKVRMPFSDGNSCTAYGVYRDVVPNERLSWDDFCDDFDGKFFHKAFVAVSFEDLGGKTRVTLRARLDPPTDRAPRWTLPAMEEGWVDGWKDNLANLSGYLPHSRTAERAMTISRVYDAPRALVWQAWTEIEHVKNWWGPRGFTTTTQSREVKAGGVWRFVMHGPDGTDYPNWVTYLEVRPPERLVYAHGTGADAVEFHTTVTFEALGPRKTRLTLHAVFVTAERHRHAMETVGAIEGGKQTLERLAGELETMTSKETL